MNQGSRFLCHRDYMLTCTCMSYAKHAVAISIHGIVSCTWGMVMEVIHLFLNVTCISAAFFNDKSVLDITEF